MSQSPDYLIIATGAVVLLAAVWLLSLMLPRLRRVANAAGHVELNRPCGKASVVVYSQAVPSDLDRLLRQVLDQDYPSEFEVIAALDNPSEEMKDVVRRLSLGHSNLRMTCVPSNTRNLSRRKLAYTLGIKAANNDIVVFTTGNCDIPSRLWLRTMASPLHADADICLGGACIVDRQGCLPKGATSFAHTRATLSFLASAAANRPYRADACNMAYRRQLFFEQSGYSRSLDIVDGDDDIFIYEMSTRRRTAIAVGETARVDVIENRPLREMDAERLRRDFTRRRLPRAPFLLNGSFSTATWLWLMASAATIVLSVLYHPFWIYITSAVAVIAIGCWLPLIIAQRSAMRAVFGITRGAWLPLQMLYSPFYTLKARIRGLSGRNKHFTSRV